MPLTMAHLETRTGPACGTDPREWDEYARTPLSITCPQCRAFVRLEARDLLDRPTLSADQRRTLEVYLRAMGMWSIHRPRPTVHPKGRAARRTGSARGGPARGGGGR